MKVLLIIFGVIALIVLYVVISHTVVNIMDKSGCKGSFVEWSIALLPIVHTIFLIKNWDLLERDTWDEQYREMNNKIDKRRELDKNLYLYKKTMP